MASIEFRLDVTGIPHTYIVINNGNGTEQMYGFAPAAPGNLWGKGHIFDESTSGPNGRPHLWDYSTGPIEVTAEQYNRVVNEINNAIQNPPYYNLPASIAFPGAVNQCATWANHLAEVGGFSDQLPWPSGMGWNPYGQSISNELDRWWRRNPDAQDLPGTWDAEGWGGIDPYGVNGTWQTAVTPVRRDPLAIDLDADGIETVGLTGTTPILFDHNADGVRTGTGWLAPDDAWLALDRDGNGSIDSGRELFGVDTQITRVRHQYPLIGCFDDSRSVKSMI